MSVPVRTESGALAPDLRDLWDQLEAIRRDAKTLVAGLRPDQLSWRPAPDRWSIAECLEHLSRTAEVAIPAIDARVADARARGWQRRGPYRPGPVERWMLRGMEPPPKVKFRVKKTLAPTTERDPEEAVTRFFRFQDEIQLRLAAASDLDLRRIKVPSPVVPWMRYRLGFAILFLLAHERRHLWQAWQVRRATGFPA
ncbi:MAG TPA: DinB family protein [Longimicrobiales bacterium]